MTEFRLLHEQRLAKVKDKTDAVFSFKDTDSPPFLVAGAYYHLFGQLPESIPEDYYDDPEVMTRFQEDVYFRQITEIDDDFVPYLLAWFGTAVLASALGARVEFPSKGDPAAVPVDFAIKGIDDIKALGIADPDKDGLMPRVLRFMRYMKQNSFLPVGITDCQGPLATANQLVGYDALFYLMYDHPESVHELMDKITESLIVWIKRQKEVIGEGLGECFGDQLIYTGKHSGVWLADDDAVLMSPELYREFVVPYNSRVFKAFGRGILHYCGNANQHIDSFLETDGLIGINSYILHDIPGVMALKERIEGRLVLLMVDFTPVDYQSYYDRLFTALSRKGLIVNSQLSPVTALTDDGKYALLRRDLQKTRREVFAFLSRKLHRRG